MTQQDVQKETVKMVKPDIQSDFAGGRAVLTEANRHTDLLYTSLAGVTAIVVVLLAAMASPVLGKSAITSPTIFAVMVLTALAGVGELCYINYKSHQHVTRQALLTEVLLNSLGQGFLSFDAEGECGVVYSQACLDLLETSPAGQNVMDILHLKGEQRSDFDDWLDMLFAPDNALGFDDVTKFFPQTFAHSGGRHVSLMYRPVRDQKNQLMSIVVIATDQTEEAEAEIRAKVQQSFVNMICRIFKERNQFLATLTHLRKFIEDSKTQVSRAEAAPVLRLLHTLKAAAKHFYLDSLGGVISKLEIDLRSQILRTDAEFQERLTSGGQEVDACLKSVLEQIGELIGQDYEGRGSLHEVDESTVYNFARTMRDQGVAPELIQQYLLEIAAVPVQECFRQFDRELKDLAEILGKKIKPVHFLGSNPKVLPKPLEALVLSMMHICRNIVDHGIEPVVTRLARGKEPAGLVTIRTDLISDPLTGRSLLQILIGDDGNGIDPALLRAKLEKIDPDGSWKQENDHAIIQRILMWGVSTKSEVSDLSGRGVGMEAVDREVRLLGGTVVVTSELYKGTCFDIRIPYTIEIP